jgi:hypothetical protein
MAEKGMQYRRHIGATGFVAKIDADGNDPTLSPGTVHTDHLGEVTPGAGVRIDQLLRIGNGYENQALAGNLVITSANAQFQRIDPNGSNRDVTLPVVASGLFYCITNTADAAENLVIKTAGGATIVTLNQNESTWLVSSASAWAYMGVFTIAQS